jgi:hypothetical protein
MVWTLVEVDVVVVVDAVMLTACDSFGVGRKQISCILARSSAQHNQYLLSIRLFYCNFHFSHLLTFSLFLLFVFVVHAAAWTERGLDPLVSFASLYRRALIVHNTAPGFEHAPLSVPPNHVYAGPILPRYQPDPLSVSMQVCVCA